MPLATLSAKKSNGLFGSVLHVHLWLMSISIPPFVVGLGLIIIFSLKLRWFSTTGFAPMSSGVWLNFKSLILPAVSLGLLYFAIYLLRAAR